MFDPARSSTWRRWPAHDELVDLLDLDRPLGKTVELIAERRGVEVRDVMVVVLDRPRHEEGIKAIREAGARVRLITDGDVAGALLAASPDRPVDLLWGIGGTPEGVITAAALKCYGGGLIGRLWPKDDDERKRAADAGYDVTKVHDARRPRQGRELLLQRHRRDRRRRPARRPLRGHARRHHRVAGHAQPVRHRAHGSPAATTAPSCAS